MSSSVGLYRLIPRTRSASSAFNVLLERAIIFLAPNRPTSLQHFLYDEPIQSNSLIVLRDMSYSATIIIISRVACRLLRPPTERPTTTTTTTTTRGARRSTTTTMTMKSLNRHDLPALNASSSATPQTTAGGQHIRTAEAGQDG